MSRLNSQHCRSPLSQNRRLLGHCLARTAKLRRKILQLRQAVTHRHYRLGIIDVNAGGKGECRDVAVNTSTRPSGGWLVIKCPPHFAQYLRWLIAVFENVATCSAPAVTRTASGFQRLKAFTGPPDHERQELQWQ